MASIHLSEYTYFYKMKTFKISYRKIKISISPRGGNFHFSVGGESYAYLKKISPQGEFHLAYVQHVSYSQFCKTSKNLPPAKQCLFSLIPEAAVHINFAVNLARFFGTSI